MIEVEPGTTEIARSRGTKRKKTKMPPVREIRAVQKPLNYNHFLNDFQSRRKPAPLRELTAIVSNLPPETISLAVGFPNVDTFPINEITISLTDGTKIALRQKSVKEALQYLPSIGYSPLIELLKMLQDKVHGKQPWEDRSLIITTGSQEGLSKTVDMCMSEGDTVIVQHPVYSGARDLFRPYRPEFILAEQDEYGVQPVLLSKLLEERLKLHKPMPKLLYVNPTVANPTGTTLPLERKIQIYRLACVYNFLILEDDPYYYVNFLEENPSSFLSLDTEGRVLRFDSFSKILSSGLRVGFVTGPKELLRRIELQIQTSTMHASSLSQVILYNVLNEWGFEGFKNHLNQIKEFYRTRRNYTLEVVEKHLTGLAEWTEPTGGMFLWLKVKCLNNVRNLVMKKCIENLLVVAPGYVFFEHVNDPTNYIRLSYSSATREQIDKGIIILAESIKSELQEQTSPVKSRG